MSITQCCVSRKEKDESKLRKEKRFNRRRQESSPIIKIGQTLSSNDLYLPYNKGRVPESKERPVIVADKNKNNELVVIPGSTQKTSNTTFYGKHGIKFYRHNLETKDNEGNPIKYGAKFRKTNKCTQIPYRDVIQIKDKVLNHTRFSSENKKKYNEFLQKKSRD